MAKDHAELEKMPEAPKDYIWWVAVFFDDPMPNAFMAPETLDPEALPKTIKVWRLTSVGIADPQATKWGVKPWWPMAVSAIDHDCWLRKFDERVQTLARPASALLTLLEKQWSKEVAKPIVAATEAQAAAAAADVERDKRAREKMRLEALEFARGGKKG